MVLYANEMKLCPFQGIKFLFFDQFKSVPHKIYDICCCEMRMSATSLTFWFIILNCVMQARPPRAFPLFWFFPIFAPIFFSSLPVFKKKKSLFYFILFFFYHFFFFFPLLSWFYRFPLLFSLIFPILPYFFPNFFPNFLTRKGECC